MKEQEYDFGWSGLWMNGYWVAGLILSGFSVFLVLYFKSPAIQALSLPVLLLALNLFIGNFMWRTAIKRDHMTLPFTDLFSTEGDFILDAGCGSGRTTIALSRVMKKGRIEALDRFDAKYIKDGGKALLQKNLTIAGISDRVRIVSGDITMLEYKDDTFDAAVSAFMLDHIGGKQMDGLKEIHRVIKPGGRFLLIVFVPGLATFAIANLFCLRLTSRKKWRSYFKETGFEVNDEGIINGSVFFLLRK